MIVHGAEDEVFGPSAGEEVFVALRRLAKKSNKIDFCDRMIAWFDKYLKPTQARNWVVHRRRNWNKVSQPVPKSR